MSPHRIGIVAATLALSLQATAALAFNCFEVIDKDQNVTYRSSQPPFAMDLDGEEWKSGQNRLRSSNLHLRWQDQRDCSPSIVPSQKAGETKKSTETVFDPNVILRATPEYMTASGRPTPMMPSSR